MLTALGSRAGLAVEVGVHIIVEVVVSGFGVELRTGVHPHVSVEMLFAGFRGELVIVVEVVVAWCWVVAEAGIHPHVIGEVVTTRTPSVVVRASVLAAKDNQQQAQDFVPA